MTTDENRGTGLTTKQMAAAAPGAVFIWCNDELSYPRQVAASIGRTDLKIFGLSVLERHRFRYLDGLQIPELVVDHAARLNNELQHGYERLLSNVRPAEAA